MYNHGIYTYNIIVEESKKLNILFKQTQNGDFFLKVLEKLHDMIAYIQSYNLIIFLSFNTILYGFGKKKQKKKC